MAKQIVFRISKDGKITSEVKGANGSACMDYLDLIKDITNGEIEEMDKTPEYYQNIVVDDQSEIQNKR